MIATRTRIALVLVLVVLLVAGVATATYVAVRSASPPTDERQVRNGPLTLIAFDRIVTLSFSGERRTIWSCKSRDERACGTPTSFAWSPEGSRLAVAVAQWSRESAVEGIYIIDRAAGKSVHILREQLGCREQYDLAWSPDGTRIAYACAGRRLYLIRADGSNPTSFATGLAGRHSSPSWSPGGNRLAFAVRHPAGSSSIYISDVDGSHVHRIADHGTAPTWSPNGTTIAYRAGCGGIKLVTPQGRDVTPGRGSFSQALRCRAIGVPGLPSWSPDGQKIAISAPPRRGTYVVDADGKHLQHISKETSSGLWGRGRPSWQPIPRRTTQSRQSDTGL
jgi:hypothetical protein